MPTTKKQQEQVARKRFWQKITRDLILFIVGLGLIINEAAIRSGDPRESLILLFAGMVGLPAVLRADELRRTNRDDK